MLCPRPLHGYAALWVLTLLVLFTVSTAGHAEPVPDSSAVHGSVAGVVRDATTRAPIPAASVLLTGTTRGTAADLDGRFVLSRLDPGTWRITVSALGYAPRTLSDIAVTAGRTRELEVLLTPAAVQGEKVVFTDDWFPAPSGDLPTSARSLRYEEVRRAPGALEDVQRTLQALPGVAGANDQSNQIVVRGGAPNENLTLIDGLEVDNTNHFTTAGEGNGGAINAINPEFIQDVTFSSGGFSARYGDRMSSVLELSLRDGRSDRFGGALDLNLGGAGGHIEGPIGDRGSYLAGAHRSFLELLPEDAVGLATVPWYTNAQARVNYALDDRNELVINTLALRDEQIIGPEDTAAEEEDGGESINTQFDALNYQSTRIASGARLRTLWSGGFTDLVVGRVWSARDTDVFDADQPTPGDYVKRLVHRDELSTIHDQLHLTWSGRGLNQDALSIGLSIEPFRFQRDRFVDGDTLLYDDGALSLADGAIDTFVYADQRESVDERSVQVGVFAQYTWRPVRGVSVTAGLRMDHHDVTPGWPVSPRVSASWDLTPRWTVSGAWGVYRQIQDPEILFLPGIPGSDPAEWPNRELAMARATHSVLGVRWLPRESTLLSVEGYVKDYDNLAVSQQQVARDYQGDRQLQSNRYALWKTRRAYGVELFAHQKLTANWYGTLAYSSTVAESEVDVASIHDEYPADYDIRHAATVTLGYQTSLIRHAWYRSALRNPWTAWLWLIPVHGDQLTLSSRFRHLSGRPYTPQRWYGQGVDSPEPVYEGHWENGAINRARYPDYQRWDLRIDNRYDYAGRSLTLYLEVQNVADRVNVAEYFYQDDGSRDTIPQFRQFWVLGLRLDF